MKDLLQLFTFKSYLQESSLVILIELLNQFWYYCKNSPTSTTTTMEKEEEEKDSKEIEKRSKNTLFCSLVDQFIHEPLFVYSFSTTSTVNTTSNTTTWTVEKVALIL